MKITVIRKDFDDDSTISDVEVDGKLVCYGLEDTVREVEGVPVQDWKIAGKTAIPCGTYPVEITYSNRFGHDTMQIMDVPGFEGIRIHAGNASADTEGCLLVGTAKSKDRVANSKLALIQLYRLVQQALSNEELVDIEFTK
jgi:hypothetical protein